MYKTIFLGLFLVFTYNTLGKPVHPELDLIINNQTCQNCKNIVGFISREDKQLNKTITDIIEIVKDICNQLVGPSGKECMYILNNIEQIMSWISAGLSTNTICHKLGFCNSTIIEGGPCLSEL